MACQLSTWSCSSEVSCSAKVGHIPDGCKCRSLTDSVDGAKVVLWHFLSRNPWKSRPARKSYSRSCSQYLLVQYRAINLQADAAEVTGRAGVYLLEIMRLVRKYSSSFVTFFGFNAVVQHMRMGWTGACHGLVESTLRSQMFQCL